MLETQSPANMLTADQSTAALPGRLLFFLEAVLPDATSNILVMAHLASCTFRSQQWLPHSLHAVFAFFATPDNLPQLMPPWQQARIDEARLVAPFPADGQMAGAGSRITLSFRPFPGSPVRLRWLAEITSFQINSHFVDRQLRGPFASWNHTHRFSAGTGPGGDAGTILEDLVEYAPPFGIVGRLADALVLRSQVQRTFDFRHRRTEELLARRLAA